MIMTWIFGREFADRTAKDLLALPTSRCAIVVAKLLVALGWCTLLATKIMVITLAVGTLLGLPGWSAGVARHGLGTFAAPGLLTFLLAAGYAWVASIGRGHLPAVAAMFGTVFAAEVIAAIGYGAWFPWSVPALLSGAAGADRAEPARPEHPPQAAVQVPPDGSRELS
jgi:ABC-2 type transport system permease protein